MRRKKSINKERDDDMRNIDEGRKEEVKKCKERATGRREINLLERERRERYEEDG